MKRISYIPLFIILLFQYSLSNKVSDICKKKLCLLKCCPVKEYLNEEYECQEHDSKLRLDFSDVLLYNINIKKTGKFVKDVFDVIPSTSIDISFENATDMTGWDWLTTYTYLIEDGRLYLEHLNTYSRWQLINNSMFCMDYYIENIANVGNDKPAVKFLINFNNENDSQPNNNNNSFPIAILVSCVFLILVLLVYMILPELRNLAGMILMAYVASLLVGFSLLAIFQILSESESEQLDEVTCIGLSFSTYYFLMASFFWMNVMSIDLRWTFRGYRQARVAHRYSKNFKFLLYSLYAWGVPLVMTVALASVNNKTIYSMPWFITPKIPHQECFFSDSDKLIYLYTPMLILLVSNWILFFLIAYRIYRLNHGTVVLETAAAGRPASHRGQRQRLAVYAKLGLIMGVSWVLEVISALMPNNKWFLISDIYNVLIGIGIFIIFVCKKKILRKLLHKCQIYESHNLRYDSRVLNSSSRSNSDSETNQSTAFQVSYNPRGTK